MGPIDEDQIDLAVPGSKVESRRIAEKLSDALRFGLPGEAGAGDWLRDVTRVRRIQSEMGRVELGRRKVEREDVTTRVRSEVQCRATVEGAYLEYGFGTARSHELRHDKQLEERDI